MKEQIKREKPSFGYALFALGGFLAIVLIGNVLFDAPLHIMFFLAWLFIIPISMRLKYSYLEINEAMMESIKNGLAPVLLLMAVGAIIGTWIASGAVPGIIYYGLKMITPNLFLLTAFVLCAMVSLATGTSWATAATAGVAMLAIGESLQLPMGMVVGAIVSGSFLGDMLSPMSDSTNIAAATTKTDLITHVKELAYISIPSFVISGVIYFLLGLQFSDNNFDPGYIASINESIAQHFNVGIFAFIPVILLIVLLYLKQPAVPAMLISSIVAAITACLYQGIDYKDILNFMWSGFKIETGEVFLDSLFNRGGVTSMLETAALLIFAFGMIGAFNKVGILQASIEPILKRINTVPKLAFASQSVALIGNFMGTNNFALLMSGSLMSPAYKAFNLHPTNLSKGINATSTVIAPLIPWNITAIYVVGLFGVSTLEYLPWAFFSYITPLIAFLLVLLNIRVIPANVDLEHGEKYDKKKHRLVKNKNIPIK